MAAARKGAAKGAKKLFNFVDSTSLRVEQGTWRSLGDVVKGIVDRLIKSSKLRLIAEDCDG